MNESRPLDKALNFNKGNLFEYMDTLLFDLNADTIGEDASETSKKLLDYITSLPVTDKKAVRFEAEDIMNTALTQTSHYAFHAGFKEACRLIKTLSTL